MFCLSFCRAAGSYVHYIIQNAEYKTMCNNFKINWSIIQLHFRAVWPQADKRMAGGPATCLRDVPYNAASGASSLDDTHRSLATDHTILTEDPEPSTEVTPDIQQLDSVLTDGKHLCCFRVFWRIVIYFMWYFDLDLE